MAFYGQLTALFRYLLTNARKRLGNGILRHQKALPQNKKRKGSRGFPFFKILFLKDYSFTSFCTDLLLPEVSSTI
jgi:hypothetical protein